MPIGPICWPSVYLSYVFLDVSFVAKRYRNHMVSSNNMEIRSKLTVEASIPQSSISVQVLFKTQRDPLGFHDVQCHATMLRLVKPRYVWVWRRRKNEGMNTDTGVGWGSGCVLQLISFRDKTPGIRTWKGRLAPFAWLCIPLITCPWIQSIYMFGSQKRGPNSQGDESCFFLMPHFSVPSVFGL